MRISCGKVFEKKIRDFYMNPCGIAQILVIEGVKSGECVNMNRV